MPDDIAPDLAEGRVKIEATRAALQAALVGQDGELAAIIARLDGIIAGVERVEGAVEAQEVTNGRRMG